MRMFIPLAAIATLFTALAAGSPALAWGCTARASDGAYGYSTDWPDEEDAELRALQECDKHTTTNDCQSEKCDPDG